MSTSSDRDYYPPRRGGSAAQTPGSGYPPRGQPVEQAGVDDDLPRRGKPVTGPVAPPRRPHPANDDLPSRRLDSLQPDTPSHDLLGRPLRPVAQASKADAEPEPEAPWDFEENKHRLSPGPDERRRASVPLMVRTAGQCKQRTWPQHSPTNHVPTFLVL